MVAPSGARRGAWTLRSTSKERPVSGSFGASVFQWSAYHFFLKQMLQKTTNLWCFCWMFTNRWTSKFTVVFGMSSPTCNRSWGCNSKWRMLCRAKICTSGLNWRPILTLCQKKWMRLFDHSSTGHLKSCQLISVFQKCSTSWLKETDKLFNNLVQIQIGSSTKLVQIVKSAQHSSTNWYWFCSQDYVHLPAAAKRVVQLSVAAIRQAVQKWPAKQRDLLVDFKLVSTLTSISCLTEKTLGWIGLVDEDLMEAVYT